VPRVVGMSGKHVRTSGWSLLRPTPVLTVAVALVAWLAVAAFLVLAPGSSRDDLGGADSDDETRSGYAGQLRPREHGEVVLPRREPRSDDSDARASRSGDRREAGTTSTFSTPTDEPTQDPTGDPSEPADDPTPEDPPGTEPPDSPPGNANGHGDHGQPNRP
jgi:hypothetical protein